MFPPNLKGKCELRGEQFSFSLKAFTKSWKFKLFFLHPALCNRKEINNHDSHNVGNINPQLNHFLKHYIPGIRLTQINLGIFVAWFYMHWIVQRSSWLEFDLMWSKKSSASRYLKKVHTEEHTFIHNPILFLKIILQI